MDNVVDLLIVGAGPAGLMAAKTAAELGLEVTIVDYKKDITQIKRACSAQLVTDTNYENETIKIQDNKILFPQNGFYVNYTGPLLNITNNYYYSPSGHKIHLAHPDNKPFAIKFDKSHLISDLWNDCRSLGVKLFSNTIACNGKDLGDYVKIDLKTNSISTSILAKKLIIAEGVNAHLTGLFGFNKNRTFYGRPLVLPYVIENTNGFEPQSWNQFYGNNYHPFAEIMIESSLESNNTVELTLVGTKNFKPTALIDNLINNSPLKKHFSNSRIIEKRGCSVKSYDSLKKPYNGNVLVIGDSAAHIEVIVQGALMCGYHAANAIKKELIGKNGFEDYTNWWNEAFDFNRMDPSEFVKLYNTLNIKANYSDEEIDYLFSLLEGERINGNFSQFEVPKNIWKAILSHRDKIKNEKPDLFIKLENIDKLNFEGKLD